MLTISIVPLFTITPFFSHPMIHQIIPRNPCPKWAQNAMLQPFQTSFRDGGPKTSCQHIQSHGETENFGRSRCRQADPWNPWLTDGMHLEMVHMYTHIYTCIYIYILVYLCIYKSISYSHHLHHHCYVIRCG